MNPLLLQMLGQQMGQQNQSPSPIDINSIFGPIGQQIEAQQPYQEPVPQGPNPFASMGSIFAGTLADMLGAQGAQANAQNRIAQREAMPIEAQQRNIQRLDEASHQKQMQRLQFMERSAEARLQVALAANDHTLAEKATKDALKAKNDQIKAQNDFDQAQQAREHGYRMAEIGKQNERPFASQIPPTPEEAQAKFDADQEKAIQNFNAKADAIMQRPGMSTKGKVRSFAKDIQPGPTEAGVRALQAHAASQAKATKYPGVREAALSRYLDTLRDPKTGTVNRATPEWMRFWSLIKSVYASPQEAETFLDSQGI